MEPRMIYHFIVAYRRIGSYLKAIWNFDKYPQKCVGIIGLITYYFLMSAIIVVLLVIKKALSIVILNWYSRLSTSRKHKYIMFSKKIFSNYE